ncbi:MAG: hypothetical protein R3A51_08740 [Nannocystaceae bacterium]|nr:hypothetical protein [Myxococcales bacterium]
MSGRRFVALIALTLLAGCDTSQSPGTQAPTTASGVTEYHILIRNACSVAVKLRLGDPKSGREVIVLENMRDSFSGKNETVWLLDGDEAIASYVPIQGSQKLRVTADCTGLVRE